MELEKYPIQLALEMGRKLQSPQTGFVHLYSEDHIDQLHHTIPLDLNFCFALSLVRSRITEQALEGIELIKKLLPFNIEGRFPKFLHNFPHVKPSPIITAVVQDLLRHYRGILGSMLILELESLAVDLYENCEPQSLEEWGEYLLFHPIDSAALAHYHSSFCIFLGPAKVLAQEGSEPKAGLFELIMGIYCGKISSRVLIPHPWHLKAALIRTTTHKVALTRSESEVVVEIEPTPDTPFRILWQEGDKMTSIEGVGPGNVCSTSNEIVWNIPLEKELEEERKERIEASIFFSLHEGYKYSIEGKKGTIFWENEEFCFSTLQHALTLRFALVEGEGKFSAHVHFGNRPSQIKQDPRQAFDLRVGFRTIERPKKAVLQARLGLSTATPIACIPLST